MEICDHPALAELESRLKQPYNGTAVSVAFDGFTVEDLLPIGAKVWFEYHCWESPESADAQLWYHSHQQAEILRLVGDLPAFTTLAERCDAGENIMYRVRFDDGFESDVFEDELTWTKDHFCRPDPPKP